MVDSPMRNEVAMLRETIKKCGYEWALRLDAIGVDQVFGAIGAAAERVKRAEAALRDARADMLAEKRRIDKRIGELWTAAEIAVAKAAL